MLIFEDKIFKDFGYSVLIAGEIEFYLANGFLDKKSENEFLAEILFQLNKNNIEVNSMGFEVAPNQYEVALCIKKPSDAIKELKILKSIIADVASFKNQKALFEAKPYDNLPGCGLHIHISLETENGDNLFKKISDNLESEIMLFSIGGLLETMLSNFIYFAPNDNSYKRFSAQRNLVEAGFNLLSAHNNAPVNVSWGGNNRTTAIRIPSSTIDETKRHIEHRVSGADAEPSIVVEKIIEGIYFGLKNKIMPNQKIYGNAYDKQYNFLKAFPECLDEAKILSKKL